ncbi:hypothetical protein KIF24_06760 [Micromonospora sp. Llam7]|uniref:hypothetical protein n=1 Tax=Micromonospora tarapacensis TaxID=2835305 RepID=UPI001C82E23A|nr:hypothetical protein [Micromonospora tarapacensis]MBX7265755.1 hypothetical protein [Micromonospora tarapacensis]
MVFMVRANSMVVRLLAAMVLAIGAGVVVMSPAVQAAQPQVTDRAASESGIAACYEGRIPNSSRWDGDISVHVHGSACTTRWAQLVWDDNNSCCVPLWVKIERQVNGSYGWLPTHTKTKKVLFGNFGTHNTATVPWVQYSNQRFRACWSASTSTPSTWNCGPFVN